MISEARNCCDDVQGASTASPFELCKPGDKKPETRGQTERFPVLPAVTPLPASSAPVLETLPASSVSPRDAPPAAVPSPFPDAPQSARSPAGGRCACYAGL